MKAILYARVSSKEQAEEGYSLQDQLRTLRQWATNNSYQVVEEVEDRGYSGASLERPGLSRIRDLVAADGVDLVLAQDRDRIARDPIIAGWLSIQFEQHGTRIRALNDPEDDSPTSRLTTGILDQIAQFERAMTTQRTRRGRLQRARNGEVIGSGSPPYGFRYNEDRTNYVVDERTMPIVRRMFEMVAAGSTLYSVAKRFETEGIPTPGGGERWYPQSMRRMILNDVYKGIWWYGKERVKLTPMGKNRRTWQKNPESEWIAIPVADSGIPPEIIEAARANVRASYRPRRPSKHYYEIGGMVYCAECGLLMTGYSMGAGYRYYSCQKRKSWGRSACDGPTRPAKKLEREVMRHVDTLLESPEKIRVQLDASIAAESRRNPDEDAVSWLRVIEDCDKKRGAFQEQQAAGLMTMDELGAKLAQLNERKTAAQRELERANEGQRRVEQLEATKRTLLRAYADGILYDGLIGLTPEMRREIYEAMRLRITVPSQGKPRISGSVDQHVIRLTRRAEDWAAEQVEYRSRLTFKGQGFSSIATAITSSEMSKLA
jgi:site-specific DNA recombinase